MFFIKNFVFLKPYVIKIIIAAMISFKRKFIIKFSSGISIIREEIAPKEAPKIILRCLGTAFVNLAEASSIK